MQQSPTERAGTRVAEEFSIVRGGPFHRLLTAAHLTGPGYRGALRAALATVGVTCLPLVAIGAGELTASGRAEPLLRDPAIYSRLVIGIPLFLFAEVILERRCQRTIERLVNGGLIQGGPPVVENIVRRAERLRSLGRIELLLLVLAIAGGQAVLWSLLEPLGVAPRMAEDRGVTAGRLWYATVALPVYQFLLYRWLWRWLIWSYVLFELSRTELRLAPTHPDHAGGAETLSEPTVAFAVFAGGAGAVVASTWATHIAFHGVPLSTFVPSFIAWIVVTMLLAFGPLLLFAAPLGRARFEAVREYGRLSLIYARLFHERWVAHDADRSVLGTPDISGLADLISAYGSMRETRLLPFGPRQMMMVAAGVVGPMAPLAAIKVPIGQLLLKIANALLHGMPP